MLTRKKDVATVDGCRRLHVLQLEPAHAERVANHLFLAPARQRAKKRYRGLSAHDHGSILDEAAIGQSLVGWKLDHARDERAKRERVSVMLLLGQRDVDGLVRRLLLQAV